MRLGKFSPRSFYPTGITNQALLEKELVVAPDYLVLRQPLDNYNPPKATIWSWALSNWKFQSVLQFANPLPRVLEALVRHKVR